MRNNEQNNNNIAMYIYGSSLISLRRCRFHFEMLYFAFEMPLLIFAAAARPHGNRYVDISLPLRHADDVCRFIDTRYYFITLAHAFTRGYHIFRQPPCYLLILLRVSAMLF